MVGLTAGTERRLLNDVELYDCSRLEATWNLDASTTGRPQPTTLPKPPSSSFQSLSRMRQKRAKAYKRLMHAYCVTFGFRQPYQILRELELNKPLPFPSLFFISLTLGSDMYFSRLCVLREHCSEWD